MSHKAFLSTPSSWAPQGCILLLSGRSPLSTPHRYTDHCPGLPQAVPTPRSSQYPSPLLRAPCAQGPDLLSSSRTTRTLEGFLSWQPAPPPPANTHMETLMGEENEGALVPSLNGAPASPPATSAYCGLSSLPSLVPGCPSPTEPGKGGESLGVWYSQGWAHWTDVVGGADPRP